MHNLLQDNIWSFFPWFGMILICGVITGLSRIGRILYGECSPSPFDKGEKAVKSGRIVAFALMTGIFSSIGFVYFSTRIKPRSGEGAIVIGIVLLAVIYTIIFEVSLRTRRGNKRESVEQIFVGVITGGILGSFLVALNMLLLVVDGFALETFDSATALLSILLSSVVLLITGVLIGGFVSGLVIISRFGVLMVHRSVFFVGSRVLFFLLGFKTVMCQNCLHYTVPSKSYYKRGSRYCEHCKAYIP